ncbi:Crp/Fnr family transcriptional regulator [Youngiibacter fragilis]|uniref:Cyclic nucleotide-binding domain-containing protein n=1 Tax=Youngiibacter fragilis 232.1 TaxID=994573 RepID=V7I8S9_9CLOT|nr:Crp/Fnr family transcriptional regulator [Youngiibacter fragilis]ETA81427.1 hypothetical protein T472_0206380 [Youngiibacter fragilis 232.1]
MTNEEKLARLLEAVMSRDIKVKLDKTFLNTVAYEDIQFIWFEKGEYLSYIGAPVERLMVLIEGQVSVFKYSSGGMSIRSGISEAPQIYGLYESLTGTKGHGVTLQAETRAHCAVIRPAFFLRAIRNNHEIALAALSFLARFTARMLDRTDQLTLNTPYENLIIFLFENCSGKLLPHVIEANKAEIAELMNISSRTLYRQLEQLEEEGLIKRSHGKIVVTGSAFQRLRDRYDSYTKEHGFG